jgi:uncharacterized protein (TIGR03437 family)
MRRFLAILVVASLQTLLAQTTSFHPLHISPEGEILNDSGTPVSLLGLNRSGTGSGNADATATDADYAAQNQLLSMNLVRIFVNATWWTNNVQVPIDNVSYQTYIDTLIQRAKKYGNYVLILKAGQFPDPPCGANGSNCPAPNQGDVNCAATPSLCPAQSTTGQYIDAALAFWDAFAQKYATDPAVLYDTWENMSGLDPGTWSDNENQLIATIRTYNPQALIFVEDTGTAFESIISGTVPDLAWSNIVWNFHLYNASTTSCTEPASPRYANWSQNVDALASYAQQNGHGVAITEWGGCNDSEPYNTNITSYARIHSIALVYFDNTNLVTLAGTNYQLTATGSKVAQAYTAIAAGKTTPAPVITLVANAEGDAPLIAPNTWVEIKGSNLARAGDSSPACAPGRCWLASDFFGNQMPAELDGVSATVNGKSAFVYYISPTQVNILTPPDAMQGPVQVVLTNAGVSSAQATVQAQALSPSFFVFNGGPYLAATHLNGSLCTTPISGACLIGPTTLYPGSSAPAKPGETVVLYANGFGPTSTPVASGSITQSGSLSVMPVIKIGGVTAMVTFAGLSAVGEFQFNVIVPSTLSNGDQPITATYGGSSTQAGTLLTIQH